MLGKNRVLVVCGVLALVAFVWWKMHPPKLPMIGKRGIPDESHTESSRLFTNRDQLFESNSQISVKNKTTEEAMQEWWARHQRDKYADWKVPVTFYGRVVDEDAKPVSGAKVHFQWTDLSTKGTSQADTVSDEQGFFSLTGVRGKNLGVYVSKNGYYTPRSERTAGFEFAIPSDSNYYQPDANNPVLFRLRKKGPGTQLVKKSIEVALPNLGSSANVDLNSGNVASAGQLVVQTWKPWPPKPISPHYDWKVELTIANGGFADAPEDFAFEAPETGYNPSLAVDMQASRGNNWNVSAEKTLYFTFDEPKKYGRLHFRTDGNSRYVFIDYVLNPSGSRNLEEASDASKNEIGK